MELLISLQKGDKKSFEAIFVKYSSQLFNVVQKFTDSRSDAEDVVQEVFSKVWRFRMRLKPELPFTPYIVKIAKNIVLNLAKKRLYETAYLSYQYHTRTKFAYTTECQVLFKELKDILEERLLTLPKKRQTVFRMSREDGLSNREIADIMDISERTVENHINQALKEIKPHLTKRI